jgi:TP901-1 family phage major tail protein
MASKGRLILIQISDGTSPAAFATIGGVRSKTITINNESVDVTTADEAPWRQLLGDTGLRSVSASGSGVFDDGAPINQCEDLAFSGALEEFLLTFENGDQIQGVFQLTSFEYGGEHTAEQTFSISLESGGICTMSRA